MANLLQKDISARIRAGALVLLVEEADETLAVESAKIAAKTAGSTKESPTNPLTIISATHEDPLGELARHRSAQGKGIIIACDLLRTFGNNPTAVRYIREVALQQRADDQPFSRLILIEVPGVEVPAQLRTDIEFLTPELPSVKELRQELDDFIEQHDSVKLPAGEARHAVASAVSGLGRHEAARLFACCFVEKQSLDATWLRTQKAARVAERLGGALTFINTDNVPEVGGMDGLESWLEQRKAAFGSEKAREFGLPEPKGVLLLGTPGGGKSLNAKSIAHEWCLPLLKLDMGRLFGSLVGQSEAQARQAIAAAEACAPCVLWLDEIEKGFASGGLDGGTSMRVFGTFLTWLQEKTSPVFVVATANRVAALPPELLRKGRFDEIFFVDLPTVEERKAIARIHLDRRGNSVVFAEEIAKASDGFSGAEIEQAVIDGMFTAFSKSRPLKCGDVLDAISATKPLSVTMKTEIDNLRDWAKGRARAATIINKTEAVGDRPSRKAAALA